MSKSWEHILGGYATDTLTDEEKHQLFEAALHDQELFDALADEEALKALLTNSEARQRILAGLQASGNLKKTDSSPRRRLGWFRKPSSLAWVGSVAAMGLALIFGWQMENDWGPMVQEEQEMERSVSQDEDHDNNKETFRSQAAETTKLKEQIQDSQKQDQSEPDRVAEVSAPVTSPQRSPMAKASKLAKPRRQESAQVRSGSLSLQEVKKKRRLLAKAIVPQRSESAIVQNAPEGEQRVAPSIAAPEAVEKSFEQLPQAPVLSDKRQERDVSISLSARELFYANKGSRVDPVGEEIDGTRVQHRLGGLSSQTEKALIEEGVDLRAAREVVQDDSQGLRKGIRYSFVRLVEDGQDEKIDITQFSGKWSRLQLVIEANVSGHLYVLTDYENGKWQLISPESLNIPRSSEGAIQVEAYQSVNFSLNQITNTLGKPVMSSISVLLSSAPIIELGKWLSHGVRSDASTDRLTEYVSTENFVIDPFLESKTPLQITIALEEE